MIVFAIIVVGFYGGSVTADVGEVVRQTTAAVVDGKSGVDCFEPVTNMQCPRDEITFWLYTQDRQDNPHQLNVRNENTIREAPWVLHKPVKILVHGYTMNKDKAINAILRPAYFSRRNLNIISVDWSPLCLEHCYKQAALSVPTVGTCVGAFIRRLTELRNDLGEIHFLGHSMGAHVTSWASLDLDLPRITQFDPAEPLFKDDDRSLFRKPKARYADVWHSNGGMKGRDGASGTVDLYLNDERDQPGCKCDASCSHVRAVEFYAETVTEGTPIQAIPCDGFQEYTDDKCRKPEDEDLRNFGEDPTLDATGYYLAFTNEEKPFIINGRHYTNPATFKSFTNKKQNCPSNDVNEFLGEVLNL